VDQIIDNEEKLKEVEEMREKELEEMELKKRQDQEILVDMFVRDQRYVRCPITLFFRIHILQKITMLFELQ
jgi:hypothetical protein